MEAGSYDDGGIQSAQQPAEADRTGIPPPERDSAAKMGYRKFPKIIFISTRPAA